MIRARRYLMLSVILAVVALGVLAVGIAAQAGIVDWSQTTVTPSHTPVPFGEHVTFTIQMVNSSTVTVEDVEVVNPIPEGTGFVSVDASHGIVGGAYDDDYLDDLTHLPKLTPNSETILTDGVKAIRWIGDVEAGEVTTFRVELDVNGVTAANPVVTDTAYVIQNEQVVVSKTGTVEVTDAPYVAYIPLALSSYTPPELPWWEKEDYPICPLEDEERGTDGANESGASSRHPHEEQFLPDADTYQCIGWISCDDDECWDADNFQFAPEANQAVTVTLTRLPADYDIVVYHPIDNQGEPDYCHHYSVSYNVGADEIVTFTTTTSYTHGIEIKPQSFRTEGPQFDAEKPYLLSVILGEVDAQ